jgi:type II secretory pathway pseudopilin PulG
MSPGHTLVELLFVLTLLAAGASVSAPAARKWSDRAAVVMAREDVVAVLLEARSLAVASGGGSVTFIVNPPSFRLGTATAQREPRPVRWDTTVAMSLGAERDSATVRFDGLGIGRFSNRTIRLERGDASASVVVSSYGRVVRR